jgi:hypothetical protein
MKELNSRLQAEKLNFQFEHSIGESEEDSIFTIKKHRISATLNGAEVGYIVFYQYNAKDKDTFVDCIDGIFIFITNYRCRGIGLGQLLYQEFGSVYRKYFEGYEVNHIFANPVAEYTHRKTVALGWIPDSALNEDRVRRSYNANQKQLWNELRKKLPENLRGNEHSGTAYNFLKTHNGAD